MDIDNDFDREGAGNTPAARECVTSPGQTQQPGEGARLGTTATKAVTPPPVALSGPDSHGSRDSHPLHDRPDPSLIAQIRLHYRLAKSAERSRIAIDQRLVSFVRVFLTAWAPGADAAEREKHKAQAARVVKALQTAARTYDSDEQTMLDAVKPHKDDVDLYPQAAEMVLNAEPSRSGFNAMATAHRRTAELLAATLPAWERLQHISGFSAWGLATIIGEAGDIGAYSGVRKLYKALGWAPTECYASEDGKATAVPRAKKGRLYGIIQDPLFRAQWRGERGPDGEAVSEKHKGEPGNRPAHPIGPFGAVYGANKERHLAAGKTKGHAEKLARRAMLKALLHDVHRGWHGAPLDFANEAAVSRFSDSCPGSGEDVREDLP